MGRRPLYSTPARAICALRAGRHGIVATSTASGKSLCYHLPVLESVRKSRSARALYVFPTKALAQDQLRKLQELREQCDRAGRELLEPDTLADQRRVRDLSVKRAALE